MPRQNDQLGRLRIAVPCQADWEGMAGDERVRHCTLCSLNVYNFAEMTRDDVRALLLRTEGRVCARLYRRADGTVITRDCPTAIRAIGRRASRIAAAVIAALCSLPTFAFGTRTCGNPRLKVQGSKVKLDIERVATSQPAVFTGVVREGGVEIPGVTIALRDENGVREFTTVTDANGAFRITSLDDGLYRVEVTLSGFKQVKIEHLQLKAGEVTHANVAMRADVTESITVGGIEMPLTLEEGSGVRLSHDLINKLPF
jgi:hypothetical protein